MAVSWLALEAELSGVWQVEFTSDKFLPYLPEDCQGNPGVYGFELAYWLSRALAGLGIVTSYPIGEDWGWLIEHVQGDAEITIGCASLAEAGEGYAGKPIRWSIFVRPHLTLKQRFRKSYPDAVVQRLSLAIADLLAAEGVFIEST